MLHGWNITNSYFVFRERADDWGGDPLNCVNIIDLKTRYHFKLNNLPPLGGRGSEDYFIKEFLQMAGKLLFMSNGKKIQVLNLEQFLDEGQVDDDWLDECCNYDSLHNVIDINFEHENIPVFPIEIKEGENLIHMGQEIK